MTTQEAQALIEGLLEGVQDTGALFLSYEVDGVTLKVFLGGTICLWFDPRLYQRNVMTTDAATAAWQFNNGIRQFEMRVSGQAAYLKRQQEWNGARAPGWNLSQYRADNRHKVAAAEQNADEQRWQAKGERAGL